MSSVGFQFDQLLRRAHEGDANAIAQLLEHYRAYLRMLARLYVGDHLRSKFDESDVVQETAIRASNSFASFEGRSEHELTAWLRSILAHVTANMVRHFHRQQRDVRLESRLVDDLNQSSVQLGAALRSRESTPSEISSRRERAVVLANALQKLPDAYREVLILREFDGLTLTEIARRMNRTDHSVQKLWVRGLVRMRELMREFDDEPK